jgi:hypothetical protein
MVAGSGRSRPRHEAPAPPGLPSARLRGRKDVQLGTEVGPSRWVVTAEALTAPRHMLACNAPMTALHVTDPRTWKAADWVTDLVPHLAYGWVTALAPAAPALTTLDRMVSRRRPAPAGPPASSGFSAT